MDGGRKPTVRKPRELNIRERKLIKALVAGKTPTQAMRDAGYAESTAVKKAAAKVGESRIQETIQQIMERRGLTDERLTEVLEEGLMATKTQAIVAEGAFLDEKSYPDYGVRHRYLETGLKLRGHLREQVDLIVKPHVIIEEYPEERKDE